MKGYGMIKVGEHGWLEKEKPTFGPMDALVRPIAIAPCSSDTRSEEHTSDSSHITRSRMPSSA